MNDAIGTPSRAATQTAVDASVAKGASLAEGGVGSAVLSEGMGCGNWHSASLEAETVESAGACVEKCRQTPGCVSVNYQVRPANGIDGIDVGSCYLLNEPCIEGPNEYWDAYALPENDRMVSRMGSHVSRQIGCSNLGEITRGDETMEWSSYECSLKCEKDGACVGIVTGSSVPECGDGNSERRCQLLYGECSESLDGNFTCVDIFYKTPWTLSMDTGASYSTSASMRPRFGSGASAGALSADSGVSSSTSSTTTSSTSSRPRSVSGAPDLAYDPTSELLGELFAISADAAEGSEEFSVDMPECFLVRDVIELLGAHPASDLEQQYTIVSIVGTTITIAPALTHDFTAGTSVLRIKHPFPSNTCGEWAVG
ncbi:unnamed protein product [Prorocentrum cordatum]|uniref:Apple domain-containing protein n=1 Tax=Prorocentrum cordatum TaxID=2364126 RepID=A0ABN9Y7Z8_9DINO|nr:unnamed protein product [Polarella glacialis]